MARIAKGILGPVSGTVGTVIGSSWKGIHYFIFSLRHYQNPGWNIPVAQLVTRSTYPQSGVKEEERLV